MSIIFDSVVRYIGDEVAAVSAVPNKVISHMHEDKPKTICRMMGRMVGNLL